MKLEFTIIVDNDDWSEEEYDEKSERKVILEEKDLKYAIERKIDLEKEEYIDDVWMVKEIK